MTLRELIQHRDTTQAALARSLGWKRGTLTKYVSGQRSPKYETAAKIAAALDAVAVLPSTPGGEWMYKPAEENSPPTTQDEINEQYSYLDDVEPDADRENGDSGPEGRA